MKKVVLLSFVMMAFISIALSQNNITLKINHKLGTEDFALNQETKNNLDQDFMMTRLEYYISEISLIHDGGNETQIEDVWILVNADSDTEVDLGEYDITSVENIRLHLGVDEEHNHLDPSSYPSSHPLSPKSPSMHWGWTSGYRFVALEGKGGADLNQLVQLHGLGDKNYFTTDIQLDVLADSGSLTIELDADYNRALEDISVFSGVIVHGDNREARKCLENFRDYVFSAAETPSSTIDISEIDEFDVFPNVITNGISILSLKLEKLGNEYDLNITAINGQEMDYLKNVANGQSLDFSTYRSGMYLVNLFKDGFPVITKKVFVK